MDEKDIKVLMDLVQEELNKDITPEEALQNLVDAGIMNPDGTYTPPFQDLLDNPE